LDRHTRRLAVVDDLRIGEADRDVIAARSELLEVSRLVRLDEGLDILGSIERVRLQPLLTARSAIGPGVVCTSYRPGYMLAMTA